ncbi:endonuclease/exonuclease/phosphatase family protein [Ornithobacterium rhinotracheale]|uniref:endonuclease/exonuclease/phosphatase family protein n=1 Tax=Ornithobacterium rhinotracheale TaxID=28251 RepID=UPI003FA49605
MKTKLLFLAFFFGFLLNAQTFEVMSYNIRYANPNDKENYWNHRKDDFSTLLNYYQPSIFSFQEVLHTQLLDIQKMLPNYDFVGVGREDGKTKGEYAPIFYNKKIWKKLKFGTFWLSQTPEKVSIGWDAALERICTFAELQNIKNRKKLWVFNVHFDHQGEKARLESAKLIQSKIKAMVPKGQAFILTGDFNLDANEAPILYLQKHYLDTFLHSNTPHYGSKGTFNAWKLDAPLETRIDYIFAQNLKILKHRHIADKRASGLWFSDHLPVLAQLSF